MAVLDPKGPVGAQEKSLILTAALLMLIVIVPVIVMAVVFSVRYRASNSRATYSPDWSRSRSIEIVVWVVPILIVSALAYLAWTRSHSLDPFRPIPSERSAITIDVISLDWKWLFIYAAQNVAVVNEVAFPVDTPIDFHLTSDTVMNSFFIPRLGSQIYTMAGMKTQLHLVAGTAGTYQGLSANFSGSGFSGMTFTARAMPQALFEQWLEKARQSTHQLDQQSYARLAVASENNPVEYFRSVEPNLFSDVVKKYSADRVKSAPMSSGS